MPGKTNNLKDKLEENQLDLSLMSLTEVPVTEIVSDYFLLVMLDKKNNFSTSFFHDIIRVNYQKEHIWICLTIY